MMRWFWSVVVSLSIVGVLSAQEFSVTAVVQKSGLSWEEAVAAILLAKTLDLDLTMIISTRRQSTTPVFILAPAFIIAKVSKKDVKDILKERSRGHGWGAIAHRLGVHPGVFNKARVNMSRLGDTEIEASVWLTVLSQAFGCPQSQIVALQQKGLDWGELIAVLQIASGARKSPDDVIKVWRETKDWTKVRAHFAVPLDWLPDVKAQKKGELNLKGSPEHEKGLKRGKGREKR